MTRVRLQCPECDHYFSIQLLADDPTDVTVAVCCPNGGCTATGTLDEFQADD